MLHDSIYGSGYPNLGKRRVVNGYIVKVVFIVSGADDAALFLGTLYCIQGLLYSGAQVWYLF
jgi:hypothetical protein